MEWLKLLLGHYKDDKIVSYHYSYGKASEGIKEIHTYVTLKEFREFLPEYASMLEEKFHIGDSIGPGRWFNACLYEPI